MMDKETAQTLEAASDDEMSAFLGEGEVEGEVTDEDTARGSMESTPSWSEPDFQTDWSDFEVTCGNPIFDDLSGVGIRMDATDFFYPGTQDNDQKVYMNQTHGYTFVDTAEIDVAGNKKVTRKFVPRIRQKIRTFKRLVPIRVTFAKLMNDDDLVEEEEDINEEMEVDEITDTVLITKKDDQGQEVVEEAEIVHEMIKDPTKKKKFIKLRMINDLGETVEELIELTDDSKRTHDIMKLATPYLKRSTKAEPKASGEEDYDALKEVSLTYNEWFKAKDFQKDQVKDRVIHRLKQARDEQKVLKEMNKYLGKKLCKYYDLKGPKDITFNYEDKSNNEEEKVKYQKRLLEFNDVVHFIFTENKKRTEMISAAEKDTQKEAEALNNEKQQFYDLEEAMLKEINTVEESKTLRSMTFRELINQQKQMDNSLSKVRIEFIRSQIALKDLQDKKAMHEASIDSMEKVDFINFEALRIKTKDLNDKLDLKEKQVLAMKDRLTQRVQALAHVRLKSDHLTVENEKLRNETKDIIEELNALRKECLLVQVERRKLEKRLSKVTSKEGIEKYPYLIMEAPTVEMKGQEQAELLSELMNTCKGLQVELQNKLEEHRIGVERHHQIIEEKKTKGKLFSFEFI